MTDTTTEYAPLPTQAGWPTADEPEDFDVQDDADREEDETEDTDAAGGEAKPKGRGRSTRGARLTVRTVRAIRAKAAELEQASTSELELLASSLGTKADVDELVAHIISTPRLTLSGFAELESIVEVAGDPFAAMAKAMQHEAHAKTIWAILASLDLVDGAKPAKEADASMAIARAAVSFRDEHAVRLDAVKQLARKGV